ncbi:hypothetical protein D3C80_1982730 [compost metagenome]
MTAAVRHEHFSTFQDHAGLLQKEPRQIGRLGEVGRQVDPGEIGRLGRAETSQGKVLFEEESEGGEVLVEVGPQRF